MRPIVAELSIGGTAFASRELPELTAELFVPVRVPYDAAVLGDEMPLPAFYEMARALSVARFKLTGTAIDGRGVLHAHYRLRNGPPAGWRWIVDGERLIADRTGHGPP